MRIILKIGAVLLAVLLVVVAGLITFFWINSPGKTPAMLDAQGNVHSTSIVSSEKVMLGGIEQWILIRGQDRARPVLLFLHGGPGSPEMAMFRAFNAALEEHFVVVNWDQRGSGKSYASAVADSTFTIKQFLQDTHELVALLQQRFGQEKIYLMGHSWGSVLGVLAVKENPDAFHAYIGVGQVANMQEGERLSYEFALNTARETGHAEAQQELEAIGMPPYQTDDWMEHLMKERNWVARFGGAWYGKDDMLDIIRPMLMADEYTLKDKVNYLLGAHKSLSLLWPELMTVNFFEQAPELKVPIFIFQGTNDYQTPYVLARQYFDKVKAPRKQFFSFTNTAHSPLYEHPETFHQLLLTHVLRQKPTATPGLKP